MSTGPAKIKVGIYSNIKFSDLLFIDVVLRRL